MLLTGLVLAVADWCRRRGAGACGGRARPCCAAGSGRPWPRGVLLRTSICRARWAGSPACSRCGSISARSISTRRWPAVPRWGALKQIKEQLRALPDHGLGYGLLRYLNPQTAQLAGYGRRSSASTILGRCRRRGGGTGPRRRTCGSGGGDPPMPLAHGIEINAIPSMVPTGRGCSRLVPWAGAADRAGSRAWPRAGSLRLRRSHGMASTRRRGPHPDGPPLVTVTQRVDGWRGRSADRGLCRCRRCRRACCSTAFMMPIAGRLHRAARRLSGRRARPRGVGERRAAEALLAPRNLRAAFRHQPTDPGRSRRSTPEREAAVTRHRLRRTGIPASANGARRSGRPCRGFDLTRAAADAPRAAPASGAAAPPGARQPSPPDRRLVGADPAAGAVHALSPRRQPRRCPGSRPYRDYLTWLARRTAPAAGRSGGRLCPVLEEPTRLAPRQIARVRRRARADRAAAARVAHRGAHRATPPQALTLIHAAGRVGRPARPAHRPRRRGVRRRGFGPAAGAAGVEHMIGSSSIPLPLRLLSCRSGNPLSPLLRSPAPGQPVALVAHQHLGLPEIQRWPGWPGRSTPWWCSRTIRSRPGWTCSNAGP